MHFSYRGGFACRISMPSFHAKYYNYDANYTSPLRVFDNFNSTAKTIATLNFCKIRNAKLKVARFLPSR